MAGVVATPPRPYRWGRMNPRGTFSLSAVDATAYVALSGLIGGVSFIFLVIVLAISIPMLIFALVGLPGIWLALAWCHGLALTERRRAAALLGTRVPRPPLPRARQRLAAAPHADLDALARLLAGAALRRGGAAVRGLDRRRPGVHRLGRGDRVPELPAWGWAVAGHTLGPRLRPVRAPARRGRDRRAVRRAVAGTRRGGGTGRDVAPAAGAERPRAARRPASTRSRRPAPAWSPRPTPSAGGSSATCTTARSSGWSRSRSRSGAPRPPTTRTSPSGCVDEAHGEAKEALVELRNLARGIHPAVLTDRGLDAAVSALAARCPVPVAVDIDLPRRCAPAVEAIAYFVVAEALTNVAKHAHATRAWLCGRAGGRRPRDRDPRRRPRRRERRAATDWPGCATACARSTGGSS